MQLVQVIVIINIESYISYIYKKDIYIIDFIYMLLNFNFLLIFYLTFPIFNRQYRKAIVLLER